MNILDTLKQHFFSFLTQEFSLPAEVTRSIALTLNVDVHKQQFGDLSSNAALVLSKLVQKNPRDIATTITQKFSHPTVAKLEIAGPGFINFYLTEDTYKTIGTELYTEGAQFFSKSPEEQTLNYSVEFVSANPTGPLHIGHGRGGIIGDVLSRVLRLRGHNVTAEFYINDAGSQIKKLGDSLKARCLQAAGLPAELPEEGYHGEYLVALAQQCMHEFGKEVIDKPDSFFAQYGKEHLLAQIKATLELYNIKFDVWFSEKTLHDSGAIDRALDLLTQRGFIYEKEGAYWFRSTDFGDDKDRVVKRGSGELTYVAADIAYLQNKLERGAQKLVMVLGQDHHSYVVRLKAVLSALGHNPDDLDVILYQLVTLKESGELVRLSKRAGRIVSLKDIIETVGVDVARFFYLNRKADAHLDFDIDLALKKTEENPVFYIQYAYVRTGSILEKAAEVAELANITQADALYLSKEEQFLLKKIVSLRTTLKEINDGYHTHALAYYVLELAHAFHSYYAAHRVINPQDINTSRGRLLAITLLRQTFKTCLDLLGIHAPQRM